MMVWHNPFAQVEAFRYCVESLREVSLASRYFAKIKKCTTICSVSDCLAKDLRNSYVAICALSGPRLTRMTSMAERQVSIASLEWPSRNKQRHLLLM